MFQQFGLEVASSLSSVKFDKLNLCWKGLKFQSGFWMVFSVLLFILVFAWLMLEAYTKKNKNGIPILESNKQNIHEPSENTKWFRSLEGQHMGATKHRKSTASQVLSNGFLVSWS